MPGTPTPRLTERDLDLFAGLAHAPLTVRQILKLSEAFVAPFTTERRLQDRLQTLGAAGYVRRWPYATTGQGRLYYHRLSPTAYRVLYGHSEPLPHPRAFGPVGIARHEHTFALAEFLVQTHVAAHRSGILVTKIFSENQLCLTAGEAQLYPDLPLMLRTPDRHEFTFYTEIDMGSERIHSVQNVESWERKIRFYEALADTSPDRFRVLAVTRKGTERLEHILAAASALARYPNRCLLYGIALPAYLAAPAALTAPCFRDHQGRPVSLIPQYLQSALPPLRPAVTTPLRAELVC